MNIKIVWIGEWEDCDFVSGAQVYVENELIIDCPRTANSRWTKDQIYLEILDSLGFTVEEVNA